jgi:hypothetical protein
MNIPRDGDCLGSAARKSVLKSTPKNQANHVIQSSKLNAVRYSCKLIQEAETASPNSKKNK